MRRRAHHIEDRGLSPLAPVLFLALIHRSAWNSYSRKFISKILHSPGPMGLELPIAPARCIEANPTSCGAAWLCGILDAEGGKKPRGPSPPGPSPGDASIVPSLARRPAAGTRTTNEATAIGITTSVGVRSKAGATSPTTTIIAAISLCKTVGPPYQ